MANVRVGGASLLAHGIAFFDPFAHWIGLDGTLFMAFLLGFPANEIVLPIALMGYLAEGALVETGDTLQLRAVLLANGWTLETAVCTLLFSLMHWPCSTTCLTIYRETRSWKWTLLAIFLPTALGLSACALARVDALSQKCSRRALDTDARREIVSSRRARLRNARRKSEGVG